MIEPDSHEQLRLAQAHELARQELERVRIVARVGQALDAHPIAADGGDEIAEIGGGGGDRDRRRHQERQEHYFLAKIAFGTMQ